MGESVQLRMDIKKKTHLEKQPGLWGGVCSGAWKMGKKKPAQNRARPPRKSRDNREKD